MRAAFIAFRWLFGLLLLFTFVGLLPDARLIYAHEALIGERKMVAPACWLSLHYYFRSPWLVEATVAISSILSLLLAIGYTRRITAGVLLYLYYSLVLCNGLFSIPSEPFIAIMLAVVALAPPGEVASHSRQANWQLPPALVNATWYAAGILYLVSGADKLLTSPTWRAGEALGCILTSSVTRPIAAEMLEALPRWVLRHATWGTLALEIGFLPMALWPRARPWLWASCAMMHVIILITLDVTQVSLAMLLFQGLLAIAFVRRPSAEGQSCPVERSPIAHQSVPPNQCLSKQSRSKQSRARAAPAVAFSGQPLLQKRQRTAPGEA